MPKLPDVVKAYIAAYNAMDVDGMLEHLAEDVVFKNKVGNEVTAESGDKAGFEALARTGVEVFTERSQTVKTAITMGESTVATIHFQGTVAVDLPNGWKAGQKLDFRGASEFQVRGGKIIRITDQS